MLASSFLAIHRSIETKRAAFDVFDIVPKLVPDFVVHAVDEFDNSMDESWLDWLD